MREDTQEAGHGRDDEYVALAAEVFTLLADVTRIRIIRALRDGELSVNDLADRVAKSPTAVSQHLAKLRWARVVQPRQDGNRVFYSLVDEHAGQLVEEAMHQAEHAVDDDPEHHRVGRARRAGLRTITPRTGS